MKTATPKKILVVEDEADSRSILRWLLESDGHQVLEAEDGPQAIELALRELPDLILMDISLPRQDGLATTREIRYYAALRTVPIIAMSAFDRHEVRDRALQVGCNDYAAKPLDLEHLETIIRKHLSPASQERAELKPGSFERTPGDTVSS